MVLQLHKHTHTNTNKVDILVATEFEPMIHPLKTSRNHHFARSCFFFSFVNYIFFSWKKRLYSNRL